jgi:hypothetical protein
MECFQQETPELEKLKNLSKKNDRGKMGKSKKKQINKQLDKVTQIMHEKRGGGGGGGEDEDED